MDSEAIKLLNDIALIDQQLQIGTSDSQTKASEALNDEFQACVREKETPSPQISSAADSPKELNLTCQRILREMEQKLLATLEENLEKQKTIMKYLNDANKKSESSDDASICSLIRCAGIPYFKDFHGYPQPRNEDVKEKISYGELLCVDYLTNFFVWSKPDKECLTKAVLNELKKKQDNSEKCSGTGDAPKQTEGGEKSIDWLKISATDMNGKYSPTECESQWKLHLSPNVNKQKWNANEIATLSLCAKKFKYQDWNAVANELNTKRSGYQCCIQYQSKNSLNEGKWTKGEDDYLKELVQKFNVNNQMSWTKISWFFQTRSRKQCQDRYLEHLRKDLKRGAFSLVEDKIIISGAKIFKDFGKLAKFLPGRAPTQIRSRYYYLIGTKMSEFTSEEDKLLLSLVKQHSKNWLEISQHFPDRSTLQCRKRFAALRREKNGIAMSELWEDNQDCKKVESELKIEKPEKGKRKRGRKTKKDEWNVYDEIIGYHENCSENYFGPRLRNPTSDDDLKQVSLKLRATMAMLSVSCDFSSKKEKIELLKKNCNFDCYDIQLLKKLSEEDATGGETLKGNYLLNRMLIPPSRCTLTGYQTISSSRSRIKLRTCEAEGLPQTSVEEGNGGEKLSFSTAKALFKSRMKSLFFLPLVLSKIPTSGLSQEVYHKAKTKKPKKMTKKRLRDHAREMNDAYREKRRKMAEKEEEEVASIIPVDEVPECVQSTESKTRRNRRVRS